MEHQEGEAKAAETATTRELIIEINATEGTMALEIVHKAISQPKRTTNELTIKRNLAILIHDQIVVISRPRNRVINLDFLTSPVVVIGAVETKEIEDNLKSISRYSRP